MQAHGRQATIGALFAMLVSGPLIITQAGAAEIPKVATLIPQDAAYVLFVSNAGQALSALDHLLKPFSSISPEIDLTRLGAKIGAEIGFNPLTDEGLSSYGIDTSGSSAFFEFGGQGKQIVALPLADPGLFKTKMLDLLSRKANHYKKKPRRKAGIEIYKVDGGFIGLKGSWCVLQPEAATGKRPDGPLIAFFGKGRKLSANRIFTRAWSRMPALLHVAYYVNPKVLAAELDRNLAAQTAALGKGIPPKQRLRLKKYFKQERKQLKNSFRLLNFVESFSAGWVIEDKAIGQTVFLGTRPSGRKTLSEMLPALSASPSFHAPLMESAVAGGWTSLKIGAVLRHFGPLELYNGFNLSDAIKREGKSSRNEIGVDPFTDGLTALKGSMAAYLLPPPDGKLDPGGDPSLQIAGLIRFAVIAEIGNQAKAHSFVDRFSAFVSRKGKHVETETVSGTKMTVVSPKPGIDMAWGIKGDSVFFVFGKSTARSLIKILPEHPWAGKTPNGSVAAAMLDFAALGEGISSAVARGAGGQAGIGFRMTVWPLVQQVLAKIDKLTVDGQLTPYGLISTSRISIR
jgi:hypothetical protein